MTIALTIIGIVVTILGIIGRVVFFRYSAVKSENAELREQVADLTRQLKEQQNAPRSANELADRLRSNGL